MSTNPFRNQESCKLVGGASSVPSPICPTKLPQASASVPALNAWRDPADPVSTVLLTEGVEDSRVRGASSPSTSAESLVNLSDVSQQDFNGGTPSIAPTGAASRSGSGTITGSTTAIAPPSVGAAGQVPCQMSQRRGGRSSRPPAPLFSSAQHSEPTTGNFDPSLLVPHVAVAGAQACGPKFRPPWLTALPSSINASYSIWAFAGLINIPFLILFFMDIIGTHYQKSKFYRQNLDLRFGIPGPIVFQSFYIIIGLGTAFANIMYLGAFIDCVSLRWGKDKKSDKTASERAIRKIPFGKGRTLHGSGVPVLVCGIIVGVLLFVAGPVVAPFVAIRTHTIPPLVPAAGLCSDSGYKTTIILRVLDREAANLTDWDEAPLYSSATFYSGSTIPFTMDLIPHHDPRYTFPSTYLFIFNSASIHENDLIALGIGNVSVGYDLGQHKYEFRYDGSRGGSELVDQDTMHDDPDDTESLSFPHLPRPIHSMERDSWISHTPLVQPHVQFVRDFSIATDIPLKTESDSTGAINCTVVKMCAQDSIDFMLTNPPTFESILVPVGRFLIEVARFAKEFCKLDKFE